MADASCLTSIPLELCGGSWLRFPCHRETSTSSRYLHERAEGPPLLHWADPIKLYLISLGLP